jgi:hypothetical protein
MPTVHTGLQLVSPITLGRPHRLVAQLAKQGNRDPLHGVAVVAGFWRPEAPGGEGGWASVEEVAGEVANPFWGSERGGTHRNDSSTAVWVGRRGSPTAGHRRGGGRGLTGWGGS